jgi:rhamnosyltransferase subunit B
MKPKVVFAGLGTKGDLFPLLGLGRELVRRGYRCDLLSNRGYEALAQAHGLGFRAVTVQQTNNLVSGQENLLRHVFPSYLPTFEYFAQELERGERLAVVNLDECSASNIMCERHHLPLCRVVLSPSTFRSSLRPAWPLNAKLKGPFANTYRLYRLPQIYARMDRAPFALPRINVFRERVGLARLDRFSDINAPVLRRLGFFPAWFGTPQPDWPRELDVVGFPLPRSSGALEPELAAFIEREGPPLVFTPGTGVVDVDAFFADARRCCERSNRPGVFLSPHYRPQQTSSRIFHAPFVELEPLLAQSALLVHHGGIGTTARALQAGIPQIIRAEAYDQPDNGERVSELGVGALFEPGQWDFDRLLLEVERLLSSDAVRSKLLALRDEIAGSDALAAAADRLEQVMASAPWRSVPEPMLDDARAKRSPSPRAAPVAEVVAQPEFLPQPPR